MRIAYGTVAPSGRTCGTILLRGAPIPGGAEGSEVPVGDVIPNLEYSGFRNKEPVLPGHDHAWLASKLWDANDANLGRIQPGAFRELPRIL